MEQKSKEWHEARKKYIGSSDIAAIMGKNPYRSAYQVWLEKTGRKEPFKGNEFTKHGEEYESEARLALMDQVDDDFAPKIIFDNENRFIASLDGINFDGDKGCEIKCPVKRYLYEEALNKRIPDMYYIQVQWQLMLSKAKSWYFSVYMPTERSSLITIEVLPDKELFVEMKKAGNAFWEFVDKDIPPEIETNEYLLIEDKEFQSLEDNLEIVQEKIKKLRDEEGIIKSKMKEFGDNGNMEGSKYKIFWTAEVLYYDYKKYFDEANMSDEIKKKYQKTKEAFYTFKHK